MSSSIILFEADKIRVHLLKLEQDVFEVIKSRVEMLETLEEIVTAILEAAAEMGITARVKDNGDGSVSLVWNGSAVTFGKMRDAIDRGMTFAKVIGLKVSNEDH